MGDSEGEALLNHPSNNCSHCFAVNYCCSSENLALITTVKGLLCPVVRLIFNSTKKPLSVIQPHIAGLQRNFFHGDKLPHVTPLYFFHLRSITDNTLIINSHFTERTMCLFTLKEKSLNEVVL